MNALSSNEISRLIAVITGGEPKRAASKDVATKRFVKVAGDAGLTDPASFLSHADVETAVSALEAAVLGLPSTGGESSDGLEVPGFLRREDTAEAAEIRKRTIERPEPIVRALTDPARAKAKEKASRGENKSAALLAKVKTKQGISAAEIKAMTGWTKIGGFFGAAKRAELTLRRIKDDNGTRWFA